MHKETFLILYKDSFNGHILSLEYCCDVTSVFHVEYCDDNVQVHMSNFYIFFSACRVVPPQWLQNCETYEGVYACVHIVFFGELAVDAVMWKLVSFKQIHNQARERKKEETNTNTKASEQSINVGFSKSFSSFLKPESEIVLNWRAGDGFRSFCGLAAKSL